VYARTPPGLDAFRESFFASLPRYEDRGSLGRGGMGYVFKALDRELNEVIAIKVLSRSDPDERETVLSRFKGEVSLNRKISHPNVCHLYDYGVAGEMPYLTMEFVEGRDLGTLIDAGPVPMGQALRILKEITRGVAAAHAAGIVHRDLKPSNIILDGDKGLKVSDLGLAREHASPGVTMATGLVGTPHYMAPESWEPGRDPDPRSDLYSMGVILYQMLFTRLPFQGSPTQILKGHISSTPQWDPPEGGYRPSEGTMAILKRLLEKDPSRRFQDAASVADACRQMLSGMSRASSGTRPGRTTPTESEADSRGVLSRMESRLEASTIHGGRRILHTTGRERILLWVLLLLLVAGALAGWFLR